MPGNWARPLLRQEDICRSQKTIADNQQKGLSELLERIARYKRALPESVVMTMAHPMMRYVYLPEFEKNPLAPQWFEPKRANPTITAGLTAYLRGAEKGLGSHLCTRPGNALWEPIERYRQILMPVLMVFISMNSAPAMNAAAIAVMTMRMGWFFRRFDENGK